MLQEDENIDNFINVTIPSLHSNALFSRDDALVIDESHLTSDLSEVDVKQVHSTNYSTSCTKSITIIVISTAPSKPKRPIICVTLASRSSKKVIYICVLFKSDSPDIFTRYK